MSHTDFSLDALPYVDKQIDEPGMRSIVDKLVAAEMKRMPKPRDPSSLFPDIELFQTDELLQQELERVRKGKPMEPQLDLSRYQLETPTAAASSQPSSTPSSSASASTDTIMEDASRITPSASEELPEGRAIWQKALENANSQLEHQNQRILNLELVQKFGNNAWNVHNYQLEYDLSLIRNAVDEKKSAIIELNKLRKRDQTEVEESLSRLEAKWASLISSTLEVEIASSELEAGLDEMKKIEAKLIDEIAEIEKAKEKQ
ncbi:hypothetical protein BGZ83_002858 [Gryganskiella cystojenkinii]|nr:hypothetical protein BGZ83_002858 [Gryganskiella cystojenkinii]